MEFPLPLIALARRIPPVVSAPAVPHHFQVEARRTTQIGLEGESLFLPLPATHQPLDRQSTRPEAQSHMRVFEPAGRKMKPRLQPGTAQPVRLDDPALAG